MVRTHRAVEADLIECANDLVHIEVTIAGDVACLLEIVVLTGSIIEAEVTYVCEVDSALQCTDHVRKVVLEVGTVRTGAEGHTVMYIVDRIHQTKDTCLGVDDSGETEYGPCRIIRVDRHLDIILVADRHDGLQEVYEVLEQLLAIDILIHIEELLDLRHTLRLPARHYGAVRHLLHGSSEVIRIDRVDGLLVVCETGGTIRVLTCELGSGPVKYRHEVVAYEVNIFLTEVLECLDVVCDVLVTVLIADLDGVADIDRLDTAQAKACSLDLFL